MSAEGEGSEDTRAKVAYRSFLVRGWRVGGAGEAERPTWRFVVQEVGSREPRRAFPDLDDLVAYLHAELEGESLPDRKVTVGE